MHKKPIPPLQLVEFPFGWAAFVTLVCVTVFWLSQAQIVLPYSLHNFFYIYIAIFVRLIVMGLDYGRVQFTERALPLLKKISLGLEFTCMIFASCHNIAAMSYLVATWNFPFIDYTLAQIDQALSFDWAYWYEWTQHHWMKDTLTVYYDSLWAQIFFLIFWFSAAFNKERLSEFFWLIILSLLITIILSGLFPAMGPAETMGLGDSYKAFQPRIADALADVLAMRSGQPIDFSTRGMGGIVFFPSFHTACAIILMYVFRQSKLTVIYVLNVGVLFSTPIYGGHYLADMIAGAFVALVTILAVRMAVRLQKRYFSQI